MTTTTTTKRRRGNGNLSDSSSSSRRIRSGIAKTEMEKLVPEFLEILRWNPGVSRTLCIDLNLIHSELKQITRPLLDCGAIISKGRKGKSMRWYRS